MSIVVTGAAGFIGMHVAEQLLERGEHVTGVDNLTRYYDPALKQARVARLQRRANFIFEQTDVADAAAMKEIVSRSQRVVHLAAQAGVRYSIDHPFAYQHSNLAGHLSVLEACRHTPGFRHLVYASSSSVYGDRPLKGSGFSEDDPVDSPVSLYAATKRACELMSGTYMRLYGLPSSGLRFFSVYGPWGRPDMAYFTFTRKILSGEPIEVFGEGRMARDFTYIDDIVDGILRALDREPGGPEHRLFNIGNGHPVGLMDMIGTLEAALGKEADKIMKPMQAGDVTATFADVSKLNALTGYEPKVRIAEGLEHFVSWYRHFYEEPRSSALPDKALVT